MRSQLVFHTFGKRSFSYLLSNTCPVYLKWSVSPTEFLYNYAQCPWWLSLGIVTATTHFVVQWPFSKILSKPSIEQMESVRAERNSLQKVYYAAVNYADVVLKKNALYHYQTIQVNWMKTAAAFYLPQAIFSVIYLASFGSTFYITTHCSKSFLSETSWAIPSLIYNFESNLFVDILNGILVGAFVQSLNKKYKFIKDKKKLVGLYSALVGMFSLFSNLILPGAFKIHCICNLVPYLWI